MSGEEFVGSFTGGLVAVFAALAILIIMLAPALYLASRKRRPKRTAAFFGAATGEGAGVSIRLSNIYVRPRTGTFGVTGIANGFFGPAVTEGEYRVANDLSLAVRRRPVSGALRPIASWLGVKFVDTGIECDIEISPGYVEDPDSYVPVSGDRKDVKDRRPLSDNERDDRDYLRRIRAMADHQQLFADLENHLAGQGRVGRSFVLIGSPTYNVLTHVASLRDPRRLDFLRLLSLDEDGSLVFDRGLRFWGAVDQAPQTFVRREYSGDAGTSRQFEEYFAVQKIVPDKESGEPTIFVCAGTCTAGTVEAVRKLTDRKLTFLRVDSRSEDRVLENESFVLIYKMITPVREVTSLEDARYEVPALPILAWSPSLGLKRR